MPDSLSHGTEKVATATVSQLPAVATEQREELRRLAEDAAPGPWHVEPGRIAWMIRERRNGPQVANAIVDADAAYIAAASPDVVLALLDALDAGPRSEGLREAAEAVVTFCNCGPDIVNGHEDACIQSEPR